MRSMRSAAIVLIVLMTLVSCNRDPNVAKRRYLESGNKYFEKGKYKEAAIMYRDALQKDLLWGPAHYKLALTFLKLGQGGGAVTEFRKAVERLPMDSPDHWDAVTHLCDIFLAAQSEPRNKPLLTEVEAFIKQLLARDANSFDGHRLTGDLCFVQARQAAEVARKEESQKLLAQAADEYRKADGIKPGTLGVILQMARAAAAQNDLATAETLFRKAIEKDKTFTATYLEFYRLEMFQHKNKEAEELLRLAFGNNPKHYEFLVFLAQHYATVQQRDEMVKVLGEIKSHAKDYPPAYLVVGDFYLRLGLGDVAIREYRQGMATDPKQKATYLKHIVEVLMRQGKRGEAADLNAQILKDDPKDNDARGLEASLLLDKGDVARALTELQSVATLAPGNPVAHYNLGRAHLARGEYAQAQQELERALDIRSDYLQARLLLAQLQVSRGDFDAALKSTNQVLSIDRVNIQARLIQAAALMGQKKFADARQLLEAMQKALPNSPDVLFQIGVVDLSEAKYKDAENAFLRAYELNPTNLRGLMGAVETYMAQNRMDAAIDLLQAESAKAPARAELKIALGTAEVRAGRFDQAIQAFDTVLKGLQPGAKERGDIYLRIGETYRRKGDLANAISAMQKARETMPDNIAVLGSLALTLDAANRWNEARQVYDAAIKIQPDNAVTLNNLAFLIADHGGDLDQALTMAQRAKQLQPNLPEVQDTLGWIYLKKNLSEEAIDLFKQLVAAQPNASTFRYHLGMAYFQKGDKPRARKELQEALKYNPAPLEKQKIQELLARV